MSQLGIGRGQFGRKDSSEFNGNILMAFNSVYLQMSQKLHAEFTFDNVYY